MTREKVEQAQKLIEDIDILENIREAQHKGYWVRFVTPFLTDNDAENMECGSDTFLDDFKQFVANEIDKLEEELRLL